MHITVREPILDTKANTYAVKMSLYFGDGDMYDTRTITGFIPGQDDALLESLLRLLADMERAFKATGRGGGDDYAYNLHVDAFEDWFGTRLERTPEVNDFLERTDQFRMEWLTQEDWAGVDGYHAEYTLDSWEVVYYDENVAPHKTEVSL